MKKYQIIYADPPWRYRDKRIDHGGCETYYPTMTKEEIGQLPISAIADKNCILFLWATFPCLPEALFVIQQWKFEYKTLGFIWVKTKQSFNSQQQSFLPYESFECRQGLGNYTMPNTEPCLIGIKGKIIRKSKSISQIIIEPRKEHSRKPDTVKREIVKLYGDLLRIELFARQKTEGWDVWGNEVESDIKLGGD